MKLLYIVLDGAADGLEAPKSSLGTANKPYIDSLAKNAHCGLVYTVGKGIAPESDEAVISILGYDPHVYYTGRGPLEAVGAGVPFKEGEVALRADLATVDPQTLRIIDRRAGRDVTDAEGEELAKSVDGLRLDGGHGVAHFVHTVAHRGVLVLSHDSVRLSGNISNTDPAYEREGLISKAKAKFEPVVLKSHPLDPSDKGAQVASELLNEFTEKAIKILDSHPVNKARRQAGKLPANAILSRDAGDKLPKAEPISGVFGMRFASVTEMPVERGIAITFGLEDLHYEVRGKTKEQILRDEARLVLDNLDKFDAFYVHLKGPDEPGHDGNYESKRAAIELIDKHFFSTLLEGLRLNDVLIIVTSDHSTPWYLKSHSDDPVPIMFSNPMIHESHDRFDERACSSGSLGILSSGTQIIPTALKIMKELQA